MNLSDKSLPCIATEKELYADTLVKLVEETQSRLDDGMLILWALAQRVSVDAKIGACIEYVKLSFGDKKTHLLFSVGKKSLSSQTSQKHLRLKKIPRILARFGIKPSLPG